MIAPKLRFSEFKDDWYEVRIGDITECIVPGRNKPKKFNGDIPWVTIPDLKDKVFVSKSSSNLQISEAEAKNIGSKIVPENSILMSCVGDLGIFSINKVPLVINQQLHAFLLDHSKYSEYFLMYALQTKSKYISSIATKTALPYLNKDNCNSIPIRITSYNEQTKIAEFLSAVDDKISQLSRQLELLNQYKKGVMQKIFSQEIRFKNDNGEDFGEWDYLQLGELIEESKAVSKKQDEFDVLTSSRRGLIKQSEYFEGSRLIDRDNVGFNIIKPHEITYRSRSDDGLFYFNFNNLGITGIISTYYPVFSFKNSNNKFVTEYLNFNKADFSKYAVGTSQLVLSLNALRTVKLRIPSKPEQEKIAEFLTAIDERIEHTTAQLTHTKQWKKGLLQQMFI